MLVAGVSTVNHERRPVLTAFGLEKLSTVDATDG